MEDLLLVDDFLESLAFDVVVVASSVVDTLEILSVVVSVVVSVSVSFEYIGRRRRIEWGRGGRVFGSLEFVGR